MAGKDKAQELPKGFTADAWAKLTPEQQETIRGLEAKAAQADAKYKAVAAASVNAEGRRSYGIRIAHPSYLTQGAAEWAVSPEGITAIKGALAELKDDAKRKALDVKADANLAKRASKGK